MTAKLWDTSSFSAPQHGIWIRCCRVQSSKMAAACIQKALFTRQDVC